MCWKDFSLSLKNIFTWCKTSECHIFHQHFRYIDFPSFGLHIPKEKFIFGRRKWQSTPVFLPWKFHGQRSLASYSPWSHKESDMIKQAQTTLKKWKPHPSTWSRQKHRIDLWLLPFLHISYQICHWLLLHINYIQILPTSNHLHYIILIWATNIFYLNCFKFPNCSPHSIFNLAISFSWWCHFFV